VPPFFKFAGLMRQLNSTTMHRNCDTLEHLMKTATIPSLRVDPALRLAAESVLHDGETLSAFMEQSLRAQIDRRLTQQAFLARGLASRDEAESSGEYFTAAEVLQELDSMLQVAQTKAST
jgi:predicted transcriptional regulator